MLPASRIKITGHLLPTLLWDEGREIWDLEARLHPLWAILLILMTGADDWPPKSSARSAQPSPLKKKKNHPNYSAIKKIKV